MESAEGEPLRSNAELMVPLEPKLSESRHCIHSETNHNTPLPAKHSHGIHIHRDILKATDVDYSHVEQNEFELSNEDKGCCSSCISKFNCSKECFRDKALSFFPVIGMMRAYQWKKWLVNDIIAGLCVGVIHIPQSMGFSILTSLPPIYGLYATIYPILIYFIFGTSRHISVGTMAVISLMVGSIVERESCSVAVEQEMSYDSSPDNLTTVVMETDDVSCKVSVAMSVALLVGILQLIMYILKLGIIAKFMPMSFISAFMAGAAFHIFTSQLPLMLGVRPEKHSGMFRLPKTWYSIFLLLPQVSVAEVISALICLFILIVLKEIINEKYKSHLKVPIPAELIVIFLGILVSHFADLNGKYNINIIAESPIGLPAPKVPSVSIFRKIIPDAFAIAIVSYVINFSLAKRFATTFNYTVDVNQEMLAYGLINVVGSFFSSFPGAQAPPRTLVHVGARGQSQLASLVSCLMVLLVCLYGGTLVKPLPKAVLASIITVAIFPLFKQFKELPELFKVHRQDFFIWVLTWFGVVFLNVDLGMYLGILVCMLAVVLSNMNVHVSKLQRFGETELFLSIETDETGDEIHLSDVHVYKFPGPLYFANVDKLRVTLQRFATSNSCASEEQLGKESSRKITPPHVAIVLDCSMISYVDMMALQLLKHYCTVLNTKKSTFYMSCVCGSVRTKLGKIGVDVPELVYATTVDAVTAIEEVQSMKQELTYEI